MKNHQARVCFNVIFKSRSIKTTFFVEVCFFKFVVVYRFHRVFWPLNFSKWTTMFFSRDVQNLFQVLITSTRPQAPDRVYRVNFAPTFFVFIATGETRYKNFFFWKSFPPWSDWTSCEDVAKSESYAKCEIFGISWNIVFLSQTRAFEVIFGPKHVIKSFVQNHSATICFIYIIHLR